MLALLGFAVMLCALAPICMAGGQMVAAFMLGRQVLAWVGLTLACMASVVIGGVLALNFGAPLIESNGAWLAPVPAAMMLCPVWALYWLGSQWIKKGALQ